MLDLSTPVVVLAGVTSMSAGDGFSLATRGDGTLWAWGRNSHGQLGLGDTADRLSPAQVTGITTAEAVAAGGQHTLIRVAGGSVLATGNNEFGQLGLGNTTSVSSPTTVPGLSGITALSAGYFHSAVFGPASQISLWGRNFEGQCGGGNSSPVTYTSPHALSGVSGTPTGIECGYHFTLIELADGSFLGTGSNSDGQLDGSSVADQDDSQKILAPESIPLLPDLIPPSLNAISPANGASGVSTTTSLVMTFDEVVQEGSGNLLIKENLGNAIVATIDISSVPLSNAEVTIDLPVALAHGTRYYVEIDAGALIDLSDNPFGGIAGSKVWSFTTAIATTPTASLIAHYSFDVDNTGTTPDSIGSAFATLGGGVSINGTEFIAGGGALEMTESGGTVATSVDGAVTSNTFTWTDDARTLTFWWKAKAPAANVLQGTYVSFGDTIANGTRFDIKESHAPGAATQGNLRVEVQGTGQTTDPTDFDDGNWHFVAVTVPDNATFADISWFVDGIATDLNASTNTLDIATGSSPLVFGDSIITPPAPNSDNRTPNGYMDEFQLYDEVLSDSEILFLYNNPGSVIGNPVEDFENYISNPAFGLDPGDQGFNQDPDGDGLTNGLEAWFGTHPGDYTVGLANLGTDGTVSTFTHPQNENPPGDISGYYQWSPNLIDWYAGDRVDGPPGGPTVLFSVSSLGATTTVTATASAPVARSFFRACVIQN
ncbi:Ig-like domain-containing protein [Verrucomicrobiaceae bacterium E54]|nr:Ig-like domain-containing protein [Verrucomicrobiaceae bacterium E54]